MTSQLKIICGKCKCDTKVVSQVRAEPQVICPECGQRDDVDEALGIARDYLVQGFKEQLSTHLGKAVKGNKAVKFTADRTPQRTYKWHGVDLS